MLCVRAILFCVLCHVLSRFRKLCASNSPTPGTEPTFLHEGTLCMEQGTADNIAKY
jgi:hypothetical protein